MEGSLYGTWGNWLKCLIENDAEPILSSILNESYCRSPPCTSWDTSTLSSTTDTQDTLLPHPASSFMQFLPLFKSPCPLCAPPNVFAAFHWAIRTTPLWYLRSAALEDDAIPVSAFQQVDLPANCRRMLPAKWEDCRLKDEKCGEGHRLYECTDRCGWDYMNIWGQDQSGFDICYPVDL